MNNTNIGNKTEKTVSSILRSHGYWSYNCPKSNTGSQPVDLIAIKGGEVIMVWLIDGKHVRNNEVSFPLNRIEDNQLTSMKYANEFAHININNLGFAIYFERTKDFYWLGYEEVLSLLEKNEKSVNLSRLKLFEEVLDESNCK